MKGGLIFMICFALPFLTAIVLAVIPFAFLYMIIELFKKPKEQPKKNDSFLGFLLNNLPKNENVSKRNQPPDAV